MIVPPIHSYTHHAHQVNYRSHSLSPITTTTHKARHRHHHSSRVYPTKHTDTAPHSSSSASLPTTNPSPGAPINSFFEITQQRGEEIARPAGPTLVHPSLERKLGEPSDEDKTDITLDVQNDVRRFTDFDKEQSLRPMAGGDAVVGLKKGYVSSPLRSFPLFRPELHFKSQSLLNDPVDPTCPIYDSHSLSYPSMGSWQFPKPASDHPQKQKPAPVEISVEKSHQTSHSHVYRIMEAVPSHQVQVEERKTKWPVSQKIKKWSSREKNTVKVLPNVVPILSANEQQKQTGNASSRVERRPQNPIAARVLPIEPTSTIPVSTTATTTTYEGMKIVERFPHTNFPSSKSTVMNYPLNGQEPDLRDHQVQQQNVPSLLPIPSTAIPSAHVQIPIHLQVRKVRTRTRSHSSPEGQTTMLAPRIEFSKGKQRGEEKAGVGIIQPKVMRPSDFSSGFLGHRRTTSTPVSVMDLKKLEHDVEEAWRRESEEREREMSKGGGVANQQRSGQSKLQLTYVELSPIWKQGCFVRKIRKLATSPTSPTLDEGKKEPELIAPIPLRGPLTPPSTSLNAILPNFLSFTPTDFLHLTPTPFSIKESVVSRVDPPKLPALPFTTDEEVPTTSHALTCPILCHCNGNLQSEIDHHLRSRFSPDTDEVNVEEELVMDMTMEEAIEMLEELKEVPIKELVYEWSDEEVWTPVADDIVSKSPKTREDGSLGDVREGEEESPEKEIEDEVEEIRTLHSADIVHKNKEERGRPETQFTTSTAHLAHPDKVEWTRSAHRKTRSHSPRIKRYASFQALPSVSMVKSSSSATESVEHFTITSSKWSQSRQDRYISSENISSSPSLVTFPPGSSSIMAISSINHSFQTAPRPLGMRSQENFKVFNQPNLSAPVPVPVVRLPTSTTTRRREPRDRKLHKQRTRSSSVADATSRDEMPKFTALLGLNMSSRQKPKKAKDQQPQTERKGNQPTVIKDEDYERRVLDFLYKY